MKIPIQLIQSDLILHLALFYHSSLNSVDKTGAFAREAHEKGFSYLPVLSEELKCHIDKSLEFLNENIDHWSSINLLIFC